MERRGVEPRTGDLGGPGGNLRAPREDGLHGWLTAPENRNRRADA
jgi:hypothetical protein